MANLKIKLDGKKFINSFLFDFKGQTTTKKCLCIPVEDNNIYVSAKTGAAYIDLVAFENQQPSQYGDTHMIKLSFPKDMLDALTLEQRKALPILGNLAPLGNGQATVPAGSASGLPATVPASSAGGYEEPTEGGLPF